MQEKGNMKDFMPLPTYISFELNAHGMVNLYCMLRDSNLLEEFHHVNLETSQGCEELYRLLRSFSPVFATKINVSVKECQSKMTKLNAMTEIKHRLADDSKWQRFF